MIGSLHEVTGRLSMWIRARRDMHSALRQQQELSLTAFPDTITQSTSSAPTSTIRCPGGKVMKVFRVTP
ncbi:MULTISPECIES: hypothetical protein [unclassified Thiocapsa]|uniref:hypothetical protein n=1 Tax=unclassified Thiocapsa TaxID=2641286 RepID=UPI0035B09E19